LTGSIIYVRYVKRLGQSWNTLKCDFTSNKLQLNEKYKKYFYGRVRFNSITITITTRSDLDRGQKGVIYLAQSRLFQTLWLLSPAQSCKWSSKRKHISTRKFVLYLNLDLNPWVTNNPISIYWLFILIY